MSPSCWPSGQKALPPRSAGLTADRVQFDGDSVKRQLVAEPAVREPPGWRAPAVASTHPLFERSVVALHPQQRRSRYAADAESVAPESVGVRLRADGRFALPPRRAPRGRCPPCSHETGSAAEQHELLYPTADRGRRVNRVVLDPDTSTRVWGAQHDD